MNNSKESIGFQISLLLSAIYHNYSDEEIGKGNFPIKEIARNIDCSETLLEELALKAEAEKYISYKTLNDILNGLKNYLND